MMRDASIYRLVSTTLDPRDARPQCNNCKKARFHCVPCEPVAFKHWQNPALRNDKGSGASAPFERDHVWVKIDPLYKFIDETAGTAIECRLSCADEEVEEDACQPPELLPSAPFERATDRGECLRSCTPSAGSGGDYDTNSPFRCEPTSQVPPTDLPRPEVPTQPSQDDRSSPPADTHATLAVDLAGSGYAAEKNALERVQSREARHTGEQLPRNLWRWPSYHSPGSDLETNANIRPHHFPGSWESHLLPPFRDADGVFESSSWSVESLQLSPSVPPSPFENVEEAELLRRFSTEVALWMDLSDLSQTFSKRICRLAVQDPLLKTAAIACAAKQLYLIGQLKDDMVAARRYYHKAVSLLRHRLGKTDQPYAAHGFAATVMFSCYEMLDATGLDWQRHLNGVFTYGRLRNINGSCGGIEQAGFWSIARQEVVCSIINRTRLRLDPDLWGIDLENIGQEGSEDLINNQVLTILAKVVDFTATLDTAFERDKQAVTERWQNLTQLLDHWERSVQDFMGPVCAYRKTGEVFSTIWFPHGVCANSWQMFHLARILLLTTNPRQGRNCMMAYRTVEVCLMDRALSKVGAG
ncbi:Fungal specific transcription factor domain-containing protein isoform 1 [Cladophialophora immunda]|nr:Fungal specific transcription factor domain-containing protein isoform 1 [Cladophialophora immunda]